MQNNTAIKSNFSELKFLDSVLQENSKDMNLIKAHGFLTALASFPTIHMPNEWLAILVGNLKTSQPVVAQSAGNGLINIYQQIHLNLYSDQEFKPVLSADYPDLKLLQAPHHNIQQWCSGYCLALVWQDQQWLYKGEDYVTNACATFFVIADLLGSQNATNQKILVGSLPEIIKSLYLYWLGDKPSLVTKIDALH